MDRDVPAAPACFVVDAGADPEFVDVPRTAPANLRVAGSAYFSRFSVPGAGAVQEIEAGFWDLI